MNQNNKTYIIKSLQKIKDETQIASNSTAIINFWNAFKGSKISYIGFNFIQNQILSIKLYYVVFTDDFLLADFPLKELKNHFCKHWLKRSKYVNQQFSNGGGLTFSIKLDFENQLEYGYYLRCIDLENCENNLIPEKKNFLGVSFEGSSDFGIYQTIKNHQISAKLYGYITPKKHFPNAISSFVNFENIRGVEIARINNEFDQKYIYLGGEDVFTTSLISQIPNEIELFRNRNELNYVCPAFSNKNELFSVYLTSFKSHTILPQIDHLITNYQKP
jgi:hypothetical protein